MMVVIIEDIVYMMYLVAEGHGNKEHLAYHLSVDVQTLSNGEQPRTNLITVG